MQIISWSPKISDFGVQVEVNMEKKMILVSSVGEIEAFLLEGIKEVLEDRFNLTALVGEKIPIPEEAFSPERSQYLAPLFLRSIKTLNAPKNLLLTHVDLYSEGLNYIFGYAIPEEGLAIVSIARFKQKTIERTLKTAVHEVGHLYGLSHCDSRRCVMHFSFDASDTDYKDCDMCSQCKNRLLEKEIGDEAWYPRQYR